MSEFGETNEDVIDSLSDTIYEQQAKIDLLTKERDEFESKAKRLFAYSFDLGVKLHDAVKALENLNNKTDVYLKLFPDDKELKSYKDAAIEALAKINAK